MTGGSENLSAWGPHSFDIPEEEPTPNESPKNENKAVPECDQEQRLASLHRRRTIYPPANDVPIEDVKIKRRRICMDDALVL